MTSEGSGPKVFIAGAPRSGTSILLFAIKAIFDLPGYGESHVMPAINQMIHSFYLYKRQFEGVEKSVATQIMLKQVSLEAIREPLFQYVRDLYRKNFPDERWVDKTPSPPGIYALPIVEEIFPDARLIVTKRSGIEVVTSHVKKFSSSFDVACDIWLSAMSGLTKIQSLCRNLIVIDQYDFSNATDQVARMIAVHIGDSERVDDLAQFLRTEYVERSSAHDWSKRLQLQDTSWSDDQKGIFRTKCGDLMDKLGYEM
jgi:hypothetical protein